jgi:hypothetical protein
MEALLEAKPLACYRPNHSSEPWYYQVKQL